jgi:shikimate kinase
MAKVLFLCGMPGSGKSTLGKKLARKLAWEFIDLDAQITQLTEKSPATWIQQAGENAFRKVEAGCLRKLDLSGNTVVSCGGGTPCFENNLDWMKANGICLFINMPVKAIFERLNQKNGLESRPLLSVENPLHELEFLWEKRRAFFEQIDWWEDGLKTNIPVLSKRVIARFEEI